MARKGRHPKGGRVTAKGTRTQGFRPREDEQLRPQREPDLIRDVRVALADNDPLALLGFVSSLLEALRPRRTHPLEPPPIERGPSKDELLHTFIEVDCVETSALLAAVAALSDDEVERRRLMREVERRGHRLPAWLLGLNDAEAYRAVEMVHVLRDGDNVVVGVRLPTGKELTATVYIDHNVGTLVKDAFVLPGSIGEAVDLMRTTANDPDTSFEDIPIEDAKVRIVEAMERAAITFPPFETDAWPACRPMIEWVARHLPDGGRGYERPEWSDSARNDLSELFFLSAFGKSLDSGDDRDLLDSVLWFGCDYGPGDPMRWSPVAVEMILADWIPRKIVADAAYLSKAPELLRAFVRFCHAERGIRSELTDETLEAIDRWEPEYQATIRSSRPKGPAALLSAIGAMDPDGPWDMDDDFDDPDDFDPSDYEALLMGHLESAVGGRHVLETLDDVPLPDEDFDWSDIPDDVRERVDEVLAVCDRCCEDLFDVEHRTACRRVLARIARNGPEVFRRRGRSETAAAAICWSVYLANQVRDYGRGRLTQKALLAHLGLTGNVSQRAVTLLDAGGFPHRPYGSRLGSPEYFVANRRRDIIERRDQITKP
jgi:hypothetical protein